MKSDAFDTSQPTTESAETATTRRSPNLIAIIFIFILLLCLTAWTAITSFALFENKEQKYPKAVIGVPLLLLLTLPPIISLLVILFRTFYTLFSDDLESFEPLDLVKNEQQRQLFLLPLSVSGTVMTILPAYYFNYGKYYVILGTQGVLGLFLVLLFVGISLVPEKSTRGLFIPIHEK